MGDVFGKGGADAARDAANVQAGASDRAIAEQQRQFEAIRSLLAPFVGYGYGALPYVAQGATAGGMGDRIAEIMGTRPAGSLAPAQPGAMPAAAPAAPSGGQMGKFADLIQRVGGGGAGGQPAAVGTPPAAGIQLPGGSSPSPFQALVDERTRAAQGQLGASGLMRSGGALLEAARIPTELALALEEQLYGRQAALANSGQNAAVMQGNAGMNAGNSVARLLQEQGAANAQGIIGAQQARAASSQSMLQTGLTAAAIFFSDPRLKENMAPIGKIGPLTLYEWDWIEGVSDVIGRMSIGFNADEVEEHFPEFVVEAHGFKAIHYPLLTAELRARYGH